MAAKTHILFLFLVLLFSANLQIEARVSVFFTKLTHFNTNSNDDNVTDPKLPHTKEPTPSPSLSPAPAPEAEGFPTPELAPVPAQTTPELQAPVPAPEYFSYTESENGYGLYGTQTSTEDDQTPATVDAEDEILSEELVGGESFERGYNQNKELYNNNNNNNNGGNPSSTRTYRTGFNNIGGNPSSTYKHYYSNGYRRNYDGNNGYNNNGYYTSSNNNPNGYDQIQRQGMSDTRFLENGRYYHDVKKNENGNYYNDNGYERAERESYKDQGYYGGSETRHEFNTMEEYEKYQESQHYVP